MTISLQGTVKTLTADGSFVFDTTPALGDLIVFGAGAGANITAPFGFQRDITGGTTSVASIHQRLGLTSETNSYAITGITGTGAAVAGAVFRATGAFRIITGTGGANPIASVELGTAAAAATVDPAGLPSMGSSLFVSALRHTAATTTATITWNGGGSTTPAVRTGRSGFDYIVNTAYPADAKAVWSLGTETVFACYSEANAGFFGLM